MKQPQSNMTKADQFVAGVEKLQRELHLTDHQVMSGLIGIVIAACREHHTDPQEYMRLALISLGDEEET